MYTCHFLDRDQYYKANRDRMALGRARGKDKQWLESNNSNYGWARLDEIVAPCAMWYCDWLFDPANVEHNARREVALAAIRGGTFIRTTSYLSRFYWTQWSDKRPPISVLCPNGKEWCVDAASNNGDGWVVGGDPPEITCSPSIQVPGYHGFLRNGVFTPNIP